jgi:proline dehydrogenase
MSVMRSVLLAASQNRWLRERAANYKFVRRSVSRFMPGETMGDALGAAAALKSKKIGAVLTHLGENVADRGEAQRVAEHYLELLRRIRAEGQDTEISVKLTQLGLDLSAELCFEHVKTIVGAERRESTVWIDMEGSNYVDATLEVYRRALGMFPNVGICLQAYLYQTAKDIEAMLPLGPSIRLVKGAYREPADIAYPAKADVDKNYFELSKKLLVAQTSGHCSRVALATHDAEMIARIREFAGQHGIAKEKIEVQMLYGIQRCEQEKLATDGCRMAVLISYGTYWYPWFVRRLAERPANLWFMLRNVFAG